MTSTAWLIAKTREMANARAPMYLHDAAVMLNLLADELEAATENTVHTDYETAREAMAALGDPVDPMPKSFTVIVDMAVSS